MPNDNIRKAERTWNAPSIERRKSTCYDCKLFLSDFCDGSDDDIKECKQYENCYSK